MSLSGIGAILWNEFQSTTLWGAIPERAANVRYYHQTLDKELGLLWSLFPIAAVVAVVSRGRAMLFAAVFVATTLALHSLAAQKDERYVFYILPFIAVLLGVGLTTAITGYWNWLRRALPDLLGERASFAMIGRVATALAAGGRSLRVRQQSARRRRAAYARGCAQGRALGLLVDRQLASRNRSPSADRRAADHPSHLVRDEGHLLPGGLRFRAKCERGR